MRSLLAALTAAVLLISVPALAQQPVGGSKRAEASGRIFTEKETEIIKGYFDKERARKPDGGETTTKGKYKGTTQAEKGKVKGKGKTASGGGKGKSKQFPPGLAKRDQLPPGLAMQLERNGTLPPGLAKRDLPSNLEGLLPTREGSLERLVVEDDVVLVDRETGVIMDILDGAARGSWNK